MDFSLLALALGLLGFIDLCTIRAHMLLLGTQPARLMQARIAAVVVFALARVVVIGGFGGLICAALLP